MQLKEANKYSKYVKNESWNSAHYAKEINGEWLVYDTSVFPAPFLYKLNEQEQLHDGFYPVEHDFCTHFVRVNFG